MADKNKGNETRTNFDHKGTNVPSQPTIPKMPKQQSAPKKK